MGPMSLLVVRCFLGCGLDAFDCPPMSLLVVRSSLGCGLDADRSSGCPSVCVFCSEVLLGMAWTRAKHSPCACTVIVQRCFEAANVMHGCNILCPMTILWALIHYAAYFV